MRGSIVLDQRSLASSNCIDGTCYITYKPTLLNAADSVTLSACNIYGCWNDSVSLAIGLGKSDLKLMSTPTVHLLVYC